MTTKLKVGQRIKINADDVLGTPESMGTIKEVCENCYYVVADDDPDDGVFPLSFDGNVLCDMP